MNTVITALIEKHLNSTLTAAEASALALALAENPALAEEFAAATRMEADLTSALKERARSALYTRRMEREAAESEPAHVRRPWPVKTLTAAAGFAALIGIGWRLMEVEPSGNLQVKKGSHPSPQGSAAGDNHVSSPGGTRLADASVMKRKLRRFASTTNRLRSVPVSQALAALATEWKDYAHGDAKDKATVFAVADAARQQWHKPEDEPAVSLEIPGISLLTSLELIAAQAGLKATVTAAGVSLDPETRRDDGKLRKWTIPLSVASVSTFMREASSGSTGIASNSASNYFDWGYIPPAGMARANRPSWMVMPELAQSSGWSNYSNSGQTIDGLIGIWDDAINTEPAAQPGSAPEIPDAVHTKTQVEVEIISRNGLLHDLTYTGEGHLNADGTISFPGSSFPITPSVPLTFSEDASIIDLNLAPEVVEFSGFMNYGTPIQPTGINALGQSEPVILTDSGITQPVFATRVLMDYPANLTRLFAAHGMPAAGATWDQEAGVVTARGPLSQLRAAQAAAAAVEEAATAGVTVEMKVIEWKNGIPTPGADRSGLLPPPVTGQSDTISAEAASDLLGDPDLERVGVTTGTQHPGVPLTLTDTRGHGDNVDEVAIADVSGITGSGYSWHLPVNIRRPALGHTETKTVDRLADPVILSLEHRADVHLQDGEWLRVDFPAKGDATAVTVLLSVQPATVQP